MTVIRTVGDILDLIEAIEATAHRARQELSNLNGSTEVITLGSIQQCVPFKFCIPVEPVPSFDCFSNTSPGHVVKIEDVVTTMRALEMWMKDIREVIENAPQDMELPRINR
jgi:hypothetical protein